MLFDPPQEVVNPRKEDPRKEDSSEDDTMEDDPSTSPSKKEGLLGGLDMNTVYASPLAQDALLRLFRELNGLSNHEFVIVPLVYYDNNKIPDTGGRFESDVLYTFPFYDPTKHDKIWFLKILYLGRKQQKQREITLNIQYLVSGIYRGLQVLFNYKEEYKGKQEAVFLYNLLFSFGFGLKFWEINREWIDGKYTPYYNVHTNLNPESRSLWEYVGIKKHPFPLARSRLDESSNKEITVRHTLLELQFQLKKRIGELKGSDGFLFYIEFIKSQTQNAFITSGANDGESYLFKNPVLYFFVRMKPRGQFDLQLDKLNGLRPMFDEDRFLFQQMHLFKLSQPLEKYGFLEYIKNMRTINISFKKIRLLKQVDDLFSESFKRLKSNIDREKLKKLQQNLKIAQEARTVAIRNNEVDLTEVNIEVARAFGELETFQNIRKIRQQFGERSVIVLSIFIPFVRDKSFDKVLKDKILNHALFFFWGRSNQGEKKEFILTVIYALTGRQLTQLQNDVNQLLQNFNYAIQGPLSLDTTGRNTSGKNALKMHMLRFLNRLKKQNYKWNELYSTPNTRNLPKTLSNALKNGQWVGYKRLINYDIEMTSNMMRCLFYIRSDRKQVKELTHDFLIIDPLLLVSGWVGQWVDGWEGAGDQSPEPIKKLQYLDELRPIAAISNENQEDGLSIYYMKPLLFWNFQQRFKYIPTIKGKNMDIYNLNIVKPVKDSSGETLFESVPPNVNKYTLIWQCFERMVETVKHLGGRQGWDGVNFRDNQTMVKFLLDPKIFSRMKNDKTAKIKPIKDRRDTEERMDPMIKTTLKLIRGDRLGNWGYNKASIREVRSLDEIYPKTAFAIFLVGASPKSRIFVYYNKRILGKQRKMKRNMEGMLKNKITLDPIELPGKHDKQHLYYLITHNFPHYFRLGLNYVQVKPKFHQESFIHDYVNMALLFYKYIQQTYLSMDKNNLILGTVREEVESLIVQLASMNNQRELIQEAFRKLIKSQRLNNPLNIDSLTKWKHILQIVDFLKGRLTVNKFIRVLQERDLEYEGIRDLDPDQEDQEEEGEMEDEEGKGEREDTEMSDVKPLTQLKSTTVTIPENPIEIMRVIRQRFENLRFAIAGADKPRFSANKGPHLDGGSWGFLPRLPNQPKIPRRFFIGIGFPIDFENIESVYKHKLNVFKEIKEKLS